MKKYLEAFIITVCCLIVPIDSEGKKPAKSLKLVGYTKMFFAGNFKGKRAANQLCSESFPGSRWANASELKKLKKYTKSPKEVWVEDKRIKSDCDSWFTSDHYSKGTAMDKSGVKEVKCNQNLQLACIKGEDKNTSNAKVEIKKRINCKGTPVVNGPKPIKGNSENYCLKKGSKLFDGYYEKLKSNGAKVIGTFKDDEKNGSWTWYYPDGKIESKIGYKGGKNHGEFVDWDKTGLKKYEASYVNGKLQSIIYPKVNYIKKRIEKLVKCDHSKINETVSLLKKHFEKEKFKDSKSLFKLTTELTSLMSKSLSKCKITKQISNLLLSIYMTGTDNVCKPRGIF